MRFLVDAQLPRHFCTWLRNAGHDTLHTRDLPLGNRTTDQALIEIADGEERVVITKDDDFVQSYLITDKPARLLLIATGNISNPDLERLITTNLTAIVDAFMTHRFVEIGHEKLVIHE